MAEYILTTDQFRDMARFVAEEMRQTYNKSVDETRHNVPVLAKELGIWAGRIREAIRAGHYGTVHSNNGRNLFYATLTEAHQYHFEGKSKKPFIKPRRINTTKYVRYD